MIEVNYLSTLFEFFTTAINAAVYLEISPRLVALDYAAGQLFESFKRNCFSGEAFHYLFEIIRISLQSHHYCPEFFEDVNFCIRVFQHPFIFTNTISSPFLVFLIGLLKSALQHFYAYCKKFRYSVWAGYDFVYKQAA
jgi:hypothetical protein